MGCMIILYIVIQNKCRMQFHNVLRMRLEIRRWPDFKENAKEFDLLIKVI